MGQQSKGIGFLTPEEEKDCTEMSVRNYHYSPHNITEERSSHL